MKKRDDGTVLIPLGEKAEVDGHFRVCILFRVATPGGSDAFRSMPVLIWGVQREKRHVTWDDAKVTVTNVLVPVALLKRKAAIVFGH